MTDGYGLSGTRDLPMQQKTDDTSTTDGALEPLKDRLAKNPDGIVERIAKEYGVSTLAVIEALPDHHRTLIDGALFSDMMKELESWGEVLFIVHTADIVLECVGKIPPGSSSHGYYNIHGDSPIGGHIRADRCTRIAFLSRPFMGRASCSVQFFNGDGEAMFKVFVRRDEKRELRTDQLALFEAARTRFATAKS
jgi:putative heme utilization carrier protein HutX